MTPVVCSIGTTDPWNAAGLGLDIRAIAELGARPVSVVAAISAQASDGLRALAAVDARLVRAQLDALEGAGIGAYRVGALADVASAAAIGEHLARAGRPAVYDPVLGASAGGRFASGELARELLLRVAPHVTLFTPNLAEAAEFAGVPAASTLEAQRDLALRLRGLSGAAVLVTGGDRDGDPRDILADAEGTLVLTDERIGRGMRGTGCLLAAAVAVELARDVALREAIARARAFVRAKLHGATAFGANSVAY